MGILFRREFLNKFFIALPFLLINNRRNGLSADKELNFSRLLQPVPKHAKFSHLDYFIWGASMVQDDEKQFHLFYSRWPKSAGFNSWVSHSEIAHAVAENPLGPYKHVDVALPKRDKRLWDGLCTHNPTVHRFGKRYYLYYMGNTGDGMITKGLNWVHRNNQRIGVAVAKHPNGPWKRFNQPLIDVSPDADAPDALMVSNPSITQKPDGRFLMVYKAVGKKNEMPFGGPVVHCVAEGDSPTSSFIKHPKPIFTQQGEKFPAEDPYIWTQSNEYFAIVKDQGGYFTQVEGRSLALFQSKDGINWQPAEHKLVTRTEINWRDTGTEKIAYLERPQLWIKDGFPTILFCAARYDNSHSFNIAIPLSEHLK